MNIGKDDKVDPSCPSSLLHIHTLWGTEENIILDAHIKEFESLMSGLACGLTGLLITTSMHQTW